MSTFRALNTLRSAARSALQTAPRRAASGVPTGYVPYHPVNKVGSVRSSHPLLSAPTDDARRTCPLVGFLDSARATPC